LDGYEGRLLQNWLERYSYPRDLVIMFSKSFGRFVAYQNADRHYYEEESQVVRSAIIFAKRSRLLIVNDG
jgi:hypothetical protein